MYLPKSGGGIVSPDPRFRRSCFTSSIPIDFLPFILAMIKETELREWQPKIVKIRWFLENWCFPGKFFGQFLWDLSLPNCNISVYSYDPGILTYLSTYSPIRYNMYELKLGSETFEINSVRKYILIDTYHIWILVRMRIV